MNITSHPSGQLLFKRPKKTKQNWKIRSENKKGVEKLELCTLLVGLQDGAAAMESR